MMVLLQHIQKGKLREQNPTQNIEPERRNLVVTRKLGHKSDIPGSGQWVVHTNVLDIENPGSPSVKPCQECWICDQHIYSIVFWNEYIGSVNISNYNQEELESI